MESVIYFCEICKKVVSPLDCWCVIDTARKTRHYECKVNCAPIIVPPPIPTPPPTNLEPFELEIKDESGESYIYTETVPEWAETYPRPTFFQRIKLWFQRPKGYSKVKTS
jgi:hypothetical protein